ncbi:hypothetical protein D5086_009267 [Populus alba]|uniref:Uncharacterized protein n=1 Tax=Populus alba TaxID=43335 RepID=A0ACC4CJB3_POPAL
MVEDTTELRHSFLSSNLRKICQRPWLKSNLVCKLHATINIVGKAHTSNESHRNRRTCFAGGDASARRSTDDLVTSSGRHSKKHT